MNDRTALLSALIAIAPGNLKNGSSPIIEEDKLSSDTNFYSDSNLVQDPESLFVTRVIEEDELSSRTSFYSDSNRAQDPESLVVTPEQMGVVKKIMASMGVKAEEIPGNMITFLTMVGQGLFGGQLAFNYLKLGLEDLTKYFTKDDLTSAAEISIEAVAGSVAIITAAAVIWGKYKLVRSFNRNTLTWKGLKEFFTLSNNHKEKENQILKAAAKFTFVIVASAVFGGLNGVSLDGFSDLLLEQSQAAAVVTIAGIATSIPSKAILGACAFISNYFGFFGIMEYGTNTALNILYRENPLFRHFTYTRAEERIFASIRTLQNHTGALYEKTEYTNLKRSLTSLLPSGTEIPELDTETSWEELNLVLEALKLSLADGTLIEKIITSALTPKNSQENLLIEEGESFEKYIISEEDKIPPAHISRRYAQYALGLAATGITAVGFWNFYTLATPSINQLSFGHYTMSEPEEAVVGYLDYVAMLALGLTVYQLGYSLLAPRGSHTVGDLTKKRQAFIIATCILGGAPNILQTIIANENSGFAVCAEVASALVEYEGFKNMEKQQYLDTLKTDNPLLWFMISFRDIMQEAIQKISTLSPEELKKYHQQYNSQVAEEEKFELPKSKYWFGSGIGFWKSTPTVSELVLNTESTALLLNEAAEPRPSRCTIL